MHAAPRKAHQTRAAKPPQKQLLQAPPPQRIASSCRCRRRRWPIPEARHRRRRRARRAGHAARVAPTGGDHGDRPSCGCCRWGWGWRPLWG